MGLFDQIKKVLPGKKEEEDIDLGDLGDIDVGAPAGPEPLPPALPGPEPSLPAAPGPEPFPGPSPAAPLAPAPAPVSGTRLESKVEVILSKMEVLKAQLDSINSRLAAIESKLGGQKGGRTGYYY